MARTGHADTSSEFHFSQMRRKEVERGIGHSPLSGQKAASMRLQWLRKTWLWPHYPPSFPLAAKASERASVPLQRTCLQPALPFAVKVCLLCLAGLLGLVGIARAHPVLVNGADCLTPRKVGRVPRVFLRRFQQKVRKRRLTCTPLAAAATSRSPPATPEWRANSLLRTRLAHPRTTAAEEAEMVRTEEARARGEGEHLHTQTSTRF